MENQELEKRYKVFGVLILNQQNILMASKNSINTFARLRGLLIIGNNLLTKKITLNYESDFLLFLYRLYFDLISPSFSPIFTGVPAFNSLEKLTFPFGKIQIVVLPNKKRPNSAPFSKTILSS